MLVGELAYLGLVDVLHHELQRVADQFQLLAKTTQVYVDPSLHLHLNLGTYI